MIHNQLLPLHFQLEAFRIKGGTNNFRDASRTLARCLFLALRQDRAFQDIKNLAVGDSSARVSTLEDVTIEQRDLFDDSNIKEITAVGNTLNLRDLVRF
jgi:hypothetical protein